MRLFILGLLCVSALAFPTLKKYNTKAGPVEGKLNVHLICHTHDDTGWLKTVDQYYYGANNTIQHAAVQYILDSVIASLMENPDRKFNYVEMAFFTRWWDEQTEGTKNIVRGLIKNGQLGFINGGWCMHDEAASHYVDMVEQTSLGHAFLANELGVIPRVTWQIDPFGHSTTQAALLSAEAGYDALYFARLDYQDREKRWAEKNMEMLWRASASLGPGAQVFTGALPAGYGPPDDFCFDISCDDEDIQDDKRLEDYNMPDRVNKYVEAMLELQKHYRGNHVINTMGEDFQYENANEWFKNLDKLIHYVNLDGRINVFYSTPEMYTDAKHAMNETWTVKEDDFFPYADGEHAYWTGYFTSRASLKRYLRDVSGLMQVTRQLEAVTGGDGTGTGDLWRDVSVSNHHDGVSGTAKQHVAYDYARRLANGELKAIDVATAAMAKLTSTKASAVTHSFAMCPQTNVSVCTVTAGNDGVIVAVVYNPLGQRKTPLLRIPVAHEKYSVYDATQQRLVSSVFPQFDAAVAQLKIGGDLPAEPLAFTVAFDGSVEAFGYTTYFLLPDNSVKVVEKNDEPVLENEHVKVTFDAQTGRIASVLDKDSGASIELNQDFLYYKGYVANIGPGEQRNSNSQNSGAYIFRPRGTETYAIADSVQIDFIGQKGEHQEARQVWLDWVTQTVRLSPGSSHVELEWTIGPVPIDDNVGKEVISRFDSNIATNGVFYTDSNGRDAMKRVRDFRPTWTLNNTLEPITSNYYPVNCFIAASDSNATMAVLTDRSEGGASMKDGSLEVMVQRRLLADDNRGVDEPLNETISITHGDSPTRIGPGTVIRGKHILVVSDPTHAARRVRTLQDEEFMRSKVFFTGASSMGEYGSNYRVSGKTLAGSLPENVQLMTLKAEGGNQFLIRLSHQFGVNEDKELSQVAKVSLKEAFGVRIVHVEELTLTANQPMKNLKRLKWKSEDGVEQTESALKAVEGPDYVVELTPLKIRTFRVRVEGDFIFAEKE